MKYRFYGNKMFVTDLIIVTIWAFFVLRVSTWNVWPLFMCIFIAMRIALCFQMYRKSSWTLYSAIVFLICGSGFAFSDKAIYPFKRIAYYIGGWLENGKEVMDAFNGELNPDLKLWLTIFGGILSLWIFVLPIVVGLLQWDIKNINWRRKWITYWKSYHRNDRSAFNILCNYKPVVRYVAFIVLLALCLFIGIERWGSIKLIALIIMPLIFYALICRCSGINPLTRHAVALSICSGLYYFIFTSPKWVKIIILSISGMLALYVAIDMIGRYRRYWIGVSLFVMPTFIVAPLILGLNPYAVLDTDSVSYNYYGYSTENGFFVIEKDGKYGLRDRFGVVLAPNYDRFQKLDNSGHYIRIFLDSVNTDKNFVVFDLEKREIVNNTDSIKIIQPDGLFKTGYVE